MRLQRAKDTPCSQGILPPSPRTVPTHVTSSQETRLTEQERQPTSSPQRRFTVPETCYGAVTTASHECGGWRTHASELVPTVLKALGPLDCVPGHGTWERRDGPSQKVTGVTAVRITAFLSLTLEERSIFCNPHCIQHFNTVSFEMKSQYVSQSWPYEI